MFFIDRPRMKAEVGSLIFGYFSAIQHGVIALSVIGIQAVTNTGGLTIQRLDNEYTNTTEPIKEAVLFKLLGKFVTQIVFMYSVLAFTFTVYLIVGITKKYPNYVQAYFIYGIVALVLHVLTLIVTCILVHIPYSHCCYAFGLMAFGGCFIYSLILMMINNAYKNMISGGIYNHFDSSTKYKEANLPKV